MNELAQEIRNYIVASFLEGEDSSELTEDFDLIGSGVVDSLALVRVISHISRTYGIPVDDIPITPESFRSIGAICAFIDGVKTPA